jgi:hypothetical protein
VGKQSYDFVNGSKADVDTKYAKLPNRDALLAIAEVFGKGNTKLLDDVDTMVTSITFLLLSAPMRIGETLRLRYDCIDCDTDKNGDTQYYFKYWVPKTKQFARKPITTTMASSALEAVKQLIHVTEDARQLARYMETDPTTFYRHKCCPDVADDEELSRDQVAQALGFLQRKSVADFILRHTGRRALKGYSLNSLWQIVISEHRQSNPHFPYQQSTYSEGYKPLKMSDSLLCFLRLQLSIRNTSSPVLLAPFNKDYFSNRLSASVKKERNNQRPMCFFTRHGFEAVRLKSHSLRHLLNRLARSSSVSVDTISAWSSRASSKQTHTYLNDDPKDAAVKGAALLNFHEEHSPKTPILDEEAELNSHGPFHRSRYGLCRRSWRAGPCNRFADCLNCSELLMCKGDKLAVGLIEKDRQHLLRNFNAAQQAIKEGERSASRWTEIAGPQIDRLTQLLSVLNDNSIPDGGPIEMAGTDFSHENTILEKKATDAEIKLLDRKNLAVEYGSELINCLNLISSNDNA